MTEQHAKDVFDEWAADDRGASMEQAHSPVIRALVERLQLAPNAEFLDIGCGFGYAVRLAADRVPAGRAVGVDVSPQMLRQARKRAAGFGNVEFHECAFPQHTFAHARFDVVFAMESVYYMPDLAAALREVHRLLKPGGAFVSAVDYYEENTASHKWPSKVGTRMRLLDSGGWRRAFEDAGFANVAQERLVVPEAVALEPWHATVGSLVTSGRRAD
jgi:ubiquinone/menaquinone biosynthesis C-methylase UbiE